MFLPNKIKRLVRVCSVLMFALAAVACSNGGSGDNQRSGNSLPSIQLNDGEVLGNGSSVVRIPATDDTGIASVSATLLRQGKLGSCGSQIDLSLAQDSLLEACLADQPICSVEFIPDANEVVVFPPPLYAPVGLEYELSFIDRDGAATDPVKAVFCFDVGANAAPVPAADTYQLVFPSTIQRNGVIYNSRCEKQPGSDGVLSNDDDDEHITNTCLQAELVDLPEFASNLSTFRNTFRSDGGFRYEAFNNAPTADSFTYRVTDGVNPPSDPIRVNIVFSGENRAPVAVNDTFTVAEDSDAQTLNVLDNDSDPDALPLSISTVTNGPTSGNATIRNGVFIEYQPNENFSGTDSFNYTIVDSAGVTATAVVEVQVAPVNDAPNAVNDTVTTDENTPISINVLANDTDPEGDALQISGVATPTNGTAVLTGAGVVTYTPATNFSGVDAFEYTITDSTGASDTATARITVNFVNVVPVPAEDFASTNEGESVLIPVLANDTDNDGDSLDIVELEQPTNGTAAIVEAQIRYTPNDNFNGLDTFRYRVSDGNLFAWAQVNVNVGAVNDAPVANDDQANTSENTAVAISVLDNDTDLDGDALSVQSVTNTSAGLTAVSTDGQSVIFTPATAFSGTATFSYTVTDNNGGAASADVTVQVSDTNFAPTAVDDVGSTSEGSAVVVDVLANDTDPDADPLTLSIQNAPANGSATVISSGIRYTPNAAFDGTDTFTYLITDAGGLTDSATVSVTVSNVNVAPLASDDSASTPEATAVTISVLANDIDADGDALTIDSVGLPNNGTAVIQGGAIVYTPDNGFSGDDEFLYEISDTSGASASALVTVAVSSVNQPPVAVDDNVSTEQDDPVSFSPLGNDSDPDGDSITILSVTQPSNGSSDIQPQADRLIYRPAAGFSGTDSFEYTIEDSNGATATATVNLSVSSVNVAPVAIDDTATTNQDTAVTIDVVGNDTDGNSDALTVSAVTDPANGSVVILNNAVVYTPDASFGGDDDTFDYTVADGNGGTDTATVTVTVNAVIVNNIPVAVADSATTDAGVPVIIDVLANDTDLDSDPLTVSVVSDPPNGTAAIVTGGIEYTPATGFAGDDDAFTYEVSDGNGGTATGTVTVTVNAVFVNNIPVAVADSKTTDAGVPVIIDVLANDTDIDLDTLTIAGVGDPANGTAALATGGIEYTPATGFSGDDAFTYDVSDGNGGTATGIVTVTVNAINNLPVAIADTADTDEDTAVVIDVLANDTDADAGTVLSLASVGAAGNGSASVANGVVEYVPAADFSGSDSFDYVVEDGNGGSATGQVSVTIAAVNDNPVALDDAVLITQDSVDEIFDVLANDTDVDLLDTLQIDSITLPPVNGTAIIVGTIIQYTPTPGFFGSDTLDYLVIDSTGATDEAAVNIIIDPIATASS